MQLLYVVVGYKQRLADWPQRGLGYYLIFSLTTDWGDTLEILYGT